MKIKQLVAHPLRCPLKEPFAYSQKWFDARTTLLVEVRTDVGITGWGEVFSHDAWPALVPLIERVLQPLVVDHDALARQVIWEKLYNWTRDYGQRGLTAAAISGIDIALWDIAGKAVGQPVYALLGGPFCDRVRAYATGMYQTKPSLDDPCVLAQEATSYVEQGFTALKVKVGFGIERDVVNVRAIRRAIGDETDLMVDANHAYDPERAISLGQRIAPFRIAWLEEPVVPEIPDAYRQVRQALSIPIAGGEAEFTRYGFQQLFRQSCLDIAQPDICITGGISETMRIAQLAQVWGVRCVPHVWGSGVALAAALHVLSALPPEPLSLNPRKPLLEYDRTENPIRDRILTTPIEMVDGQVLVPSGHGLGVTVDRDVIERYGVS